MSKKKYTNLNYFDLEIDVIEFEVQSLNFVCISICVTVGTAASRDILSHLLRTFTFTLAARVDSSL